MQQITVHEGASEIAIFAPMYDAKWSDATKAGQAVQEGDVTTVYFYVKDSPEDSAWLMLSSINSSQINWVGGSINVYFNADTSGHAGDGQYYELRVKMADGSYQSMESGAFNVVPSIVGNP